MNKHKFFAKINKYQIHCGTYYTSIYFIILPQQTNVTNIKLKF